MKRDWFRRGVRMAHRFDQLEERNDPLGIGTFDSPWPKRVDNLEGASAPGHPEMRPLSVQREGEALWREPGSAVVKPNGVCASINGPAPDFARLAGLPIPVGTKRRLGPPRTDR